MSILLLLTCAGMLLPACQSTGGHKIPSGVPSAIRSAVREAPGDALVGIGMAPESGENYSLARTAAEARARTALARQLGTLAGYITQNHAAAETRVIVSLGERMSAVLVNSNVSGSVIIKEERDGKGNYWAAAVLSKEEIVREIARGEAAAKNALPAAASVDLGAQIDEAVRKVNSTELKVNGR